GRVKWGKFPACQSRGKSETCPTLISEKNMSAPVTCPDVAELRKLVDGSATAQVQAELARHLDGCPACQAALERLGAGSGNWGDLAEPPAVDAALAGAMDRLEADPGRVETAAEHRPEDGKLNFLDPPEKPGQIGKLAHYEVLEVIGRGGMGIVLKAFDPKL